jgi:hypothetical protein
MWGRRRDLRERVKSCTTSLSTAVSLWASLPQKRRRGQKGDGSAQYDKGFRHFLCPLLQQLTVRMDVPLVHTLRDGVEAIVRLRDCPQELWLTELDTLLGAAHAPAGMTRISRLLRASTWTAHDIDHWLLTQMDGVLAQQPDHQLIVLLDESVAEKPESLHAEGRTRVRSSKASHLARPRPGYGAGSPPTRLITVPGLHWLAVAVTGWSGAALLTCCRWQSPTAPETVAQKPTRHDQPAIETQLLRDLCVRLASKRALAPVDH